MPKDFVLGKEEKVVSGISLGSVLIYKIVALSFPWYGKFRLMLPVLKE
jgi:hypothetical protein